MVRRVSHRGRGLAVATIALLGIGSSRAAAEQVEPIPPGPGAPTSIPPAPDGYDAKKPLSKPDLKRKREKGYVTGLPLASFDVNTGVGGGVRLYYYYNGEKDDPFFSYTPYLHRVFLQAFFTTGGLQFHWLDYDAPAFLGTAYRLRSQLIYARNTAQHFYGIGSYAMQELTFTGAGQSFPRFSNYTDALREIQADGTTLARYNEYDLTRPTWAVSVERTFFKGLVRVLAGALFSYAVIDDYTGEQVEAGPDGDQLAEQRPTLLRERCDAGVVVGCDGGFDNYFRLGISYDTRDFEPDPNKGIFADMALDLSTVALGSEYNYVRYLASVRGYYPLFPEHIDLVLAGRLTFQAQSSDVPVSSIMVIPWTDDFRSGLGGIRTLRGFRQDRFLGRYFTLANLELRWTFYRFAIYKERFSLGVTAFSDNGRVYDHIKGLTFANWRYGQGAGLRIAWNQATIASFDLGRSSEDLGFYVNFNHQF